MLATVQTITLKDYARIIAISDIHGELELFKELLTKVKYAPGADALVLLGDLYLKGSQPLPTLRYIMELAKTPGVFVLRGNCDFAIEEYVPEATPEDAAWLDALPIIIESEEHIFVHAGLQAGPLHEQDLGQCVKTDAFMEQDIRFDKWVVAGHWPVNNYCHDMPNHSTINDFGRRIISIDGGNVVQVGGQLNAHIFMQGGRFTYDFVDKLEDFVVPEYQEAWGDLNITFLDRYVERIWDEDDMTLCRHATTGRMLLIPTAALWQEGERWCGCGMGTNYYLWVFAGETVKLVAEFETRWLAKKDGVVGWIAKPGHPASPFF